MSKCQKPVEGLTPRQVEALRLIGYGNCTGEIATKMNISKKTVEFHRVSLLRIFNVTGPIHLARIAIAFGLSTLCLILCALPLKAAGQTVSIALIWDNPGPSYTGLVYRVYYTTNIASPTNQWPLLATIPNPSLINGGAQLAWTNAMTPGAYFFTMTSSNLWGTSFFSQAAATPPAPPLLNNLNIQKAGP